MADHGHGHGHGHGHAHVDPAVDKRAAFMGLLGGVVVLGAMIYGMVMWTNAQFAGHGEGAEGGARPAATAAP